MEYKRRHERYKFLRAGTIYWLSADGQVSCAGECFEASTYGLSAEVSQFIPVGTKTTIHLDQFDESIEATVCHCRKQVHWYRIGLKLTQELPLVLQSHLSVREAKPAGPRHVPPPSKRPQTTSRQP